MTNLRIDVHSHLLPGLDDGSASVDESVAIARRMADAGYSHMCCTPHIWPGYPDYRPDFITARTAELQEELRRADVPLRLIPGGEINLDMPIETMRLDAIPTYGMRGLYALFDFWIERIPPRYLDRIDHLRSLGVRPILAHPERIAAFQKDPTQLDRLAERGVWFQGNLQCLSDRPGRPTRDLAERWLVEKRYFMLGSDTHNLATLDVRLNGLKVAEELVGAEELDRLTRVNPSKLLD